MTITAETSEQASLKEMIGRHQKELAELQQAPTSRALRMLVRSNLQAILQMREASGQKDQPYWKTLAEIATRGTELLDSNTEQTFFVKLLIAARR